MRDQEQHITNDIRIKLLNMGGIHAALELITESVNTAKKSINDFHKSLYDGTYNEGKFAKVHKDVSENMRELNYHAMNVTKRLIAIIETNREEQYVTRETKCCEN